MTVSGRVEAVAGELPTLEYRLVVAVAGPRQAVREVATTVDTGFNGWLALPMDIIWELELTRHGRRPARLASGAIEFFNIYGALISWDGQLRPVPVHEIAAHPLLGMRMLLGYRLTADNRQGGAVVIEELPPPATRAPQHTQHNQ